MPDPSLPDILVVDDDPFQRKVIRAWLEAAGWPVLEAENVDQALELIAGAEIALVDLRLADADGLELARRISELPMDRPPALVAMSASMSESVRRRCREVGFVHTLAKPLQRQSLLRLLDTVGGLSVRQDAPRKSDQVEADRVPEALRDVPALAALWRMEQRTSEPELMPAVESLRSAGRLLVSSVSQRTVAVDSDAGAKSLAAKALADVAHGLAGAAGMLGCTRVEATSRALASRTRRQGIDEEARLLVTVIEHEVETAVEKLKREIEGAYLSSYQ